MVGRVLEGKNVLIIGTTAEKSFQIRYDMPSPALEAALHAQPIIWYIAVPFGCPFSFACADHMYTPVSGKAPSVLLRAPPSSQWEIRGAVPAQWCGAPARVRRPVAFARPAGCRARRVLSRAVPRGSGGVCVGASVWLPEVRVAWLCGGSLSSSPPQVYWDPVSWCSMFLNPLPWDITCMRVVCPDAGTLCALQWDTHSSVSWCMIFLAVMRAGGFQGWCALVSGPPARRGELGSAQHSCLRRQEPAGSLGPCVEPLAHSSSWEGG